MVKFNKVMRLARKSRTQDFLLLLLLITGPAAILRNHYGADVQNKEGIHFVENKWAEVLKMAASEHKYIFVDCFASWCGPCKQLRQTTFNDKNVGDFFNQNFINLSLDIEKGEGVPFAAELNVRAIPTLLIFSPSGTPVLKAVGYLNAEELVKFGNTALQQSH
jgi:thiol:disulfide interchange protein